MNAKVAQKLADMPSLYRGIYKKAIAGKSKTAAIHAFCLECMGWQRTEVRDCTTSHCPLHAYKPYES
jgi:hypothetical protein